VSGKGRPGGYKRKAPVAVLLFDDYEGLEVRAKAPAMGALLGLADLAEAADADARAARKLLEEFAGYLVSWTVEDDDGPVPATLDGLLSLDTPFVLQVVKAWIDGLAGVDPTSPARSPAGGIEAEIPMTLLQSS